MPLEEALADHLLEEPELRPVEETDTLEEFVPDLHGLRVEVVPAVDEEQVVFRELGELSHSVEADLALFGRDEVSHLNGETGEVPERLRVAID